MRRTNGARSTLIWTGVCFTAFQLVFAVWADLFRPALYDPEFAARVDLLRERLDERPDDRLLLLFGSSRSVLAFRPERLPALSDADDRTVMPFNFAHTSAGPVYSLLSFRRVLREGIVPDFAVIEVMPLLLREESTAVYSTSAVLPELPWLDGYVNRWKFYSGYMKTRFLPSRKHRRTFMTMTFPDWQEPATDWLLAPDLDALGGERKSVKAQIDVNVSMARIRSVRASHGPLFPELRIDPKADAALRTMLHECRERGIRTALLLAPESPEFRLHYSPNAQAQLDGYIAELRHQYECELIDAREWLDEADFADGHHVVLSGQAAFTDRLGADFLTRWIKAIANEN